ncbi:MAG: chaperone modulator CbpM [Cyclobacteriaceae bacterium]
MQYEKLIAIEEVCAHHKIDSSFVYCLKEKGLIKLVRMEEAYFMEFDQLPFLEKYIEFHYALEIKMEGIATISQLLRQVKELQEDADELRNRLHFYESI